MSGRDSVRVLAVADSDSYLKWVSALLAAAPADWRVEQAVLVNVLEPSPSQRAAAAPGVRLTRRTALGIAARVRRTRPDVLVVACTGPALEALMEVLAVGGCLGDGRPLLVTGLPGISYPANDLAVQHRRDFDLMVVHSHREVAAYADVVARLGVGPRPVLATLPFFSAPPIAEGDRPVGGGHDVVFAAQALVPAQVADRRRILAALAALPADLEPVVKVRALGGERQAHNEAAPYADLWAAMPDHPREITFRAGSMRDALARAAGFATVSSTAALEALAAGVPCLVLGDFGVDAATITLVFEGSGLIGDLDDLATGRFRRPDAAWLRDNYFHDPGDDEWVEAVAGGAAARRRPVRFSPLGGPLTRARRLARLTPRGWATTAASAAAALRRPR